MLLRFHQQTLDLLGLAARPSQTAVSLLAQAEEECGLVFPASVKEWYSLEDAVAIMSANSNDDHFINVADLGRHLAPGREQRLKDLLWLGTENQGVCHWAVRLDGSQDPEVLVNFANEPDWRPCASHFSVFVWTLAFDWGGGRAADRLFAQAQPIDANDLRRLRDRFNEHATTLTWPGEKNYRFSAGDGRILIWSTVGQADWHIRARTPQLLLELTRTIWDLSNLSISLYGIEPAATEVLKQLRANT